jgi:hypothetical protein
MVAPLMAPPDTTTSKPPLPIVVWMQEQTPPAGWPTRVTTAS